MNVEVREVKNGWMVRPGDTQRGYYVEPIEVTVFNKFEDLVEFLKNQSEILKRDKPSGPEKIDTRCKGGRGRGLGL